MLINSTAFWFFVWRLETVYSDSIRKAELEARLQYLKVSFSLFISGESAPDECPAASHTDTHMLKRLVACWI